MSVANTIGAMNTKIDEQRRLLDTLEYYQWLKFQGISYSDVCGLREGKPKVRRFTSPERTLDVLLKDGSNIVIPWPPFDDDVIFKRKKTDDR